MENLLLYLPQVKNEKMIPLPIGLKNKFPPIALGVCYPIPKIFPTFSFPNPPLRLLLLLFQWTND
jgi:hypothetical protein